MMFMKGNDVIKLKALRAACAIIELEVDDM